MGSESVDPCIEKTRGLQGVVIGAPAFPGWENPVAMTAHFRFVHDHQKQIAKIALVTESAMGNVVEHLASHFLSAQIKHFPAGEIEVAKNWIMDGV